MARSLRLLSTVGRATSGLPHQVSGCLSEFDVETGQLPSWPLIEMRRPCISSSPTLSTVPALPSVRITALPTSSVWARVNSPRIVHARYKDMSMKLRPTRFGNCSDAEMPVLPAGASRFFCERSRASRARAGSPNGLRLRAIALGGAGGREQGTRGR
jgi:hypothetical protein